MRELIHLVARVIDIKFTGHIVARPAEHLGKAVAEHAAARVAHMHGAGRVGGNKLHHDFFGVFGFGAPVVPAKPFHRAERVGIPAAAKGKIQEARSRNGDLLKIGAVQHHRAEQRLGDFAGGHAQRLGALHREGRSPVAVGGVLRGFDGDGGHAGFGQRTGKDSGLIGGADDFRRLAAGVFHQIHINTPILRIGAIRKP